MITIKSPGEIELMRNAGRITAAARALAGDMVKPGITTKEIDEAVYKFITAQGAIPAFLGYNGFPASICASVNDAVIHGIPSGRILRDGDIVSIDVGAVMDGYVGDCAATFVVGNGDEVSKRLIEVTRQSFYEGIKYAREGHRVSDISHAIQSYVESFGYSIVREFVGHGIGANMHEPPEVPNYGPPGHGSRLTRGMTLAIEPMVNEKGAKILIKDDGWTVTTADGGLSAHYENTILITSGEPEILTVFEDV